MLTASAPPQRFPKFFQCVQEVTKKRRGVRVVTSGQFLKKGLPGRVDTSGTPNAIKSGKLKKLTFHDEHFKTKNGGPVVTSPHVEARHEHGT